MEMEIRREFADRLKALRSKHGLTQEQMAEKVGLTGNAYVKIENTYNSPSLKVLVKLSDFFNVSLDILIFGKIDEKKEMSTRDRLDQLLNLTDSDEVERVIAILERVKQAATREENHETCE